MTAQTCAEQVWHQRRCEEGLGKVHEASALHKEPQTTKQSWEWAWEEWSSQVKAQQLAVHVQMVSPGKTHASSMYGLTRLYLGTVYM